MPEKTKPAEAAEGLDQNNRENPNPDDDPEAEGDSTWAQDQRERDYYYDDSHGYEIYDPAGEEDE